MRFLGDDGDESDNESGDEEVDRPEEEEEEDGSSVQEESVSHQISMNCLTCLILINELGRRSTPFTRRSSSVFRTT